MKTRYNEDTDYATLWNVFKSTKDENKYLIQFCVINATDKVPDKHVAYPFKNTGKLPTKLHPILGDDNLDNYVKRNGYRLVNREALIPPKYLEKRCFQLEEVIEREEFGRTEFLFHKHQ